MFTLRTTQPGRDYHEDVIIKLVFGEFEILSCLLLVKLFGPVSIFVVLFI